MRRVIGAALTAGLLIACSSSQSSPPAHSSEQGSTRSTAATSAPTQQSAEPRSGAAHLKVEGTRFLRADGREFEWRGITAFRLAELVAHGREAESISYLDWARSQKLTVVRVLLMATHLFTLSQADGLAALPKLLTLAAERQLHVEVVVLADTADAALDLPAAVKAAGAVARAHPNAVVEIANEPWHPTQTPFLHDPVNVARLAEAIPSEVPVALGSIERADGYAAGGRYATWHSPRSNAEEGWGHVLALAEGAVLPVRWRKPVISDEPIGAGEAYQPGRRDNDPRRFAAAAVLTRLAGLGATFHYEGGLHARVPSGRELACFAAWSSGLDAIPTMPAGGEFRAAGGLSAIARVSGARGLFGRVYDAETWVVVIDPGASMQLTVGEGWREADRRSLPGATVVRLVR